MADEIIIPIEVEGSKKATQQLKSVNTSVSSLTKSVGSLALGFASLNAAVSQVQNLVKFEQGLAEISTIAGEAGKSTQELAKELLNVSDQFGGNAAEQAKTLYQIISAGATDAAIQTQILTEANKLAVGGLTEASVAADALTGAINVYGSSALSAAKAGDILFTGVRLGKTRVDELSATIGQVTPIANQLGVSFADTVGAVAQLTTVSGDTGVAVTQLRSILTGLIKNQERATEVLGENADAFSIAALRSKGLVGFLKDLNTAAGGSEDVFIKLFGRVEAFTGVAALAADGFVGLSNALDATNKSTGALDDAFSKVQNTIGQQLSILGSRLNNLVLRFSIEGANTAVAALKSVNSLLLVLSENLDIVLSIVRSGAILLIGRQFFKIAATIKASSLTIVSSLTLIEKSLLFLRRGIQLFKSAISFGVLLAIDLAIEKIIKLSDEAGGLGNLLSTTFDTVARNVEIFGLSFEIAFNKALIAITDFINNGLKKLIGPINKLRSIVGKDPITVSLELDTSTFEKRIANFEKQIADIEKSAVIPLAPEDLGGTAVAGAAKPAAANIDTPTSKAVNALVAPLEALGELLGLNIKQQQAALTAQEKNAAAVATQIGSIAGAVSQGAAGAIKIGLQTAGGALFGPLGAQVAQSLAPVIDILSKNPEEFARIISTVISDLPRIIFNIVQNLIATLPKAVAEGIQELFNQLPIFLERFVQAVADTLLNPSFLVSLATGIATAFIRSIPRIVTGLVRGLTIGITNIFRDFPKLIADAIGKAISNIGKVGGSIIEGIPILGDVFGAASDVFGGIGDALGFQKGGEIPAGFPNDTFPARLTSGENVVDRSTNEKLNRFLDGQGRGARPAVIEMDKLVLAETINEMIQTQQIILG